MIKKKNKLNNKIGSSIVADITDSISVLQSFPVGVIIYSLKNILFANSAAFKILNFDKV